MELARNITAIVALGMIGAGFWVVYPPSALIVVGVIVLMGILNGSRRIERKHNDP